MTYVPKDTGKHATAHNNIEWLERIIYAGIEQETASCTKCVVGDYLKHTRNFN